MGVSPADMGFPDEPGSPLVYNFGYRCAAPLLMWLQLERLLDDGLKPRAVLVMVSDDEIRSAQFPDNVVRLWAPRFSSTDLRRLAPYADEPESFHRLSARRNPWVDRRPALVTDLPAGWRMKGDRIHTGSWERMDRLGFSPFPAALIAPGLPETTLASLRQYHASLVDVERPPASSMRVFGDLTERCRTAGIALAVCWAPDCPSYQTTYTAHARGAKEERARSLTAALSVPVFPAPPELTDDDFADGYHLHARGAKKYSRWLAETHLRAWLVDVLK